MAFILWPSPGIIYQFFVEPDKTITTGVQCCKSYEMMKKLRLDNVDWAMETG